MGFFKIFFKFLKVFQAEKMDQNIGSFVVDGGKYFLFILKGMVTSILYFYILSI
jgi:hypothetical protein